MTCNEVALKLAADYAPGGSCNSQASQFKNACCNKNANPTEYEKPQAAPESNPYGRGSNPECPICHYGVEPTKPNTVTAVLGMKGNPTCKQLDLMGKAGQITTKMCKPMQDYMDIPCGCYSRWGVSGGSGSTNKAPSNTDPDSPPGSQYKQVSVTNVSGGYTKNPSTNTGSAYNKPTTQYNKPTTQYNKPSTGSSVVYIRTTGNRKFRGLKGTPEEDEVEETTVIGELTEENPFMIVQEFDEPVDEEIGTTEEV
jgi:hypothetical protein